MKILEVKNIEVSYKENKVLDNITFSINEGEVVALIGPNGAGKTTLMKILSNLLKADAGEVKICGVLASDNREIYLSKLSSIIETPSLYEELSGYDNIKLISKINNISQEKINSIIEFINIGNELKKKVSKYSLGMKQRLALGIALLTEPKILILDEPTNGLDSKSAIEFKRLLIDLVENHKMSILISSHILSYLDNICTRVLFLKETKIIDRNIDDIKLGCQTIILGIKNQEEVVSKIENMEFVNNVNIINSHKISIETNSSNTANLINKITKQNIKYSTIEILNNNIEKIYTNLYEEK
ncbi:ABC transporter ATP-binding protein [Clostridium tarantellae]|uniref:ATP-binding cassette domain-containing protein n=1 Tax=Clostridium tarantellae TaxID=39493 RepID=A0A6I1MP48_9CLOT|nr:ABC transporter ATP-binding protein [Clostridium tarantellae]MPQ44844.1 ATP-binding cassette domain-containing protein [Clostridium tarantellae]